MPQFDPIAVGAFAGLQAPRTEGADVVIRVRDGLGLAALLVRKGQAAALASRILERFGIDLPRGPRRVAAGEVSLMGTGPGTWLAIRENAGNAFASSLRDAAGDFASVVDQADGLAVVRLSGARVRDALCKLVAIDLDPHVFQPGEGAVTPVGHIGAIVWRLDDATDGTAIFEIAVHRSYAASFWHALMESAGEFSIGSA